MKAPSKCPMCKEKKKWIKVDEAKKPTGNGTIAGALVGAVKGGLAGALVGGVIGSSFDKSKKVKQYVCGSCGFSHIYED